MKRLLLSSFLLLSTLNAQEHNSTTATKNSNQSLESISKPELTQKVDTTSLPITRKSGWYAGLSMGLMNWGGEVTIDEGSTERTYNVDTEDKPIMLKLGYKTANENRVELYFKDDSIDAHEDGNRIDMYDTSTFGIDYQWGLSSLSSEKILPYIRVGIGFGSADFKGESVDLDAIDFALATGIYYEAAPNIDIMAGVYRRAVSISSDESDTTVISILNGLEFGVNYHF